VAALAVVEDLDVVKDLGAKLGLGRPGAAVDELLLERREEALGDGVDAPMSRRIAVGRRGINNTCSRSHDTKR
jgi:hypothetical protein